MRTSPASPPSRHCSHKRFPPKWPGRALARPFFEWAATPPARFGVENATTKKVKCVAEREEACVHADLGEPVVERAGVAAVIVVLPADGELHVGVDLVSRRHLKPGDGEVDRALDLAVREFH